MAAGWAEQVERRRDVPEPLADRVARWTTSPWPGIPVFLAVSIGMFLAVITIGGWLAALLGEAWNATVSPFLATAIPALVPFDVLSSALLWALDGGVLGMLAVGIPYVLTFYLFLAALEDSGYLTSAAVLLDRVFGRLGLPGRASIPLLAAAGCNVPAIYGTRVLRTRRERLLASWLVTLTPCSARSAVVIAALAPFAGVQVAIGAFLVIGAAAIAAGLGANAMIPGRQPSLVLELAPLRAPLPAMVVRKAWWRFKGFVVQAAPIMLVGSLVLGLVYEAGLWQGFADVIGPATEAVLGLPAIAGVAMAFAFLRKELALQLLLVFAAVSWAARRPWASSWPPGSCSCTRWCPASRSHASRPSRRSRASWGPAGPWRSRPRPWRWRSASAPCSRGCSASSRSTAPVPVSRHAPAHPAPRIGSCIGNGPSTQGWDWKPHLRRASPSWTPESHSDRRFPPIGRPPARAAQARYGWLMTDPNAVVRYTAWAVYARTGSPADGAGATAQLEAWASDLAPDDVVLRGVYDVSGLRADADLMLWLHGPSAESLQAALRGFRRTAAGAATRLALVRMGTHRPAEFSRDHVPSFMRGTDALGWLCVYPFVRSYEWYLLPEEERREMLREHGLAGRAFPKVQANTVAAFALNDYEWILALEADDLHDLVDLMRDLRVDGGPAPRPRGGAVLHGQADRRGAEVVEVLR